MKLKLKSFLFLTAALALGLALLGCSSDSDDGGTTTITDYRGYASDAEEIMAAFKFADNVYLTRKTTLTTAPYLVIPAGKTLHVNGQTIEVGPNTIIIGAGGLNWDGSDDSEIDAAANGIGAVLIGIDYADGHYGTNGAAGTESDFIFVPKDGTVKSNSDNSKSYIATDDTSKLLLGGSYLAAVGGTTAYFTGPTLNLANLAVTGGGTLVVTGDLTGLSNLNTTTLLTVYGKLSGGTDAATAFITGEVKANTADITGGQIGTLSVENGEFGPNPVTFATLSVTDKAMFKNDVAFTAGSIVNAVFTSGIKVGGNAQVGNLSFAGSSHTLVLDKDGEIIFTGGITPAFFTGAGTLAALDGSLSITVETNELTINAAGESRFTVNDDITLTGAKKINVTGSAGLYFTDQSKKIKGDGYYFGGGVPGTLSTSNYKGFILTADGIEGASSEAASRPIITFGVGDSAGGTLLTILKGLGSLATIKDANIDLATTGTIAFEAGGSATIFLASGGSITTGSEDVPSGTLAYGGYIISDAKGGSIVAGSLGGSMSVASIGAGSAGTTADNFIFSTKTFVIGDSTTNNGSASVASGSASSNPIADAAHGGSIAVFNVN